MDLKKEAEQGNLNAIQMYVEELIKENNYVDAQKWALKGTELGSRYCMKIYIHTTKIVVHVRMQISPDVETAERGIQELLNAEKWAKVLLKEGELENDSVLTSSTGIYSQLTWCYYFIALSTKETETYRQVVDYFERIKEKAQSRDAYAYMMALDALGEEKRAFEVASNIHEEHDDTLKPFMLEVVCGHLMKAFLNGNVVQPNYEKAEQYAQECYDINPKDNAALLKIFKDGTARREFDQQHKPNTPPKQGCYIATCVYGTYDCPEVWTLRRYRDSTLKASWYGRTFIWLYYRISPFLVSTFGNQAWFTAFWKSKLDSWVIKLNGSGVSNTKYIDD